MDFFASMAMQAVQNVEVVLSYVPFPVTMLGMAQFALQHLLPFHADVMLFQSWELSAAGAALGVALGITVYAGAAVFVLQDTQFVTALCVVGVVQLMLWLALVGYMCRTVTSLLILALSAVVLPTRAQESDSDLYDSGMGLLLGGMKQMDAAVEELRFVRDTAAGWVAWCMGHAVNVQYSATRGATLVSACLEGRLRNTQGAPGSAAAVKEWARSLRCVATEGVPVAPMCSAKVEQGVPAGEQGPPAPPRSAACSGAAVGPNKARIPAAARPVPSSMGHGIPVPPVGARKRKQRKAPSDDAEGDLLVPPPPDAVDMLAVVAGVHQ